jgi:uncharacterized SAM-binding protein YcdF (DUF218 family)
MAGVAWWISAAAGGTAINGSRADVAVVLGAAVDDTEPSPVFAARIDHAINLWREKRVKFLLLTGARSSEDTLAEGESAARYALAHGISPEAIIIETRSRTTGENIQEAQRLMRARGLTTTIIVSDPLHLRRAGLLMAAGMAGTTSPTPATRYQGVFQRAKFLLREVVFIHVFWLRGS